MTAKRKKALPDLINNNGLDVFAGNYPPGWITADDKRLIYNIYLILVND